MRKIKKIHSAEFRPIADLITYSPMPTRSLQMIDPFLFLNHHGFQTYPAHNNGLPFGPHPHRGMETVTFIVEGDIMHKDCSYIGADESLQLAATMMDREDIGSLPVAQDEKLVGMITDRDIVTRAVATNQDVRHTRVGQVMSDQVLYCHDDDDIEKVAENMAHQKVRRLPVMTREKELCGMVTLGDIATEASRNAAGEALSKITEHA